MSSLSQHYQQMVGLDDDWIISDVELDVEAQRLTLSLEFIGPQVTCPECSAGCSMKDHALEPRKACLLGTLLRLFGVTQQFRRSTQTTIGCAAGGTWMRCSFRLCSRPVFLGVRARHAE